MRNKIIMTALMVVVFLTACAKDPLSPTVTVEYKVTGTAEAVDLDYIDADGELAILNGVQVPWELSFSADRGRTVLLSAKNTGTTGTVTVTIYVNGNVFDEETVTGAATATAEGTI